MLPLLRSKIPGSRSRALARELRRYESHNVTFISRDWPIFWERARGTNVWDADGNRYLDLTSAFGVANLGHHPPRVITAAREQLNKLTHAMGDVHPNELKVRLARELSGLTFERWEKKRGKVLFANSGSEAVEAALKTAKLATGKSGVLAFRGAYHGLTYGALDATGWEVFRKPFQDQLPGFTLHVDRTEEAVQKAFRSTANPQSKNSDSKKIGAVLFEPIPGRGGGLVPDDDFLRMLRRVCDREGALLIADEVFTGFCRTGRWFAVEHWGVVPDVICVGKAMSNGFPISACIGRGDVMDQWPESTGEALHTCTHLGNPLGCAMALATLAEMKRLGLANRAARLSERLPGHGRGLMKGVSLPDATTCQRAVKRLLQRGLLALGAGENGDILQLTPPLTISEADLDFAAQEIKKAIQ